MLIRTRGLFYNRYTVTKQIYLEQELQTYLFQNFIMKMQMVPFKNILHSNKKIETEDAISELGRLYYTYTPTRRTTYTINSSSCMVSSR